MVKRDSSAGVTPLTFGVSGRTHEAGSCGRYRARHNYRRSMALCCQAVCDPYKAKPNCVTTPSCTASGVSCLATNKRP